MDGRCPGFGLGGSHGKDRVAVPPGCNDQPEGLSAGVFPGLTLGSVPQFRQELAVEVDGTHCEEETDKSLPYISILLKLALESQHFVGHLPRTPGSVACGVRK